MWLWVCTTLLAWRGAHVAFMKFNVEFIELRVSSMYLISFIDDIDGFGCHNWPYCSRRSHEKRSAWVRWYPSIPQSMTIHLLLSKQTNSPTKLTKLRVLQLHILKVDDLWVITKSQQTENTVSVARVWITMKFAENWLRGTPHAPPGSTAWLPL